MSRSAFISTSLVFVLLLAAGSAGAEKKHVVDKAKEAEAHKIYDEATALYSLGQFPEAAERYKAAYTLLPDSAMLYNIAQAYRQANDFKNALFFYRSFLRANPNASTRAQVEDRIAKLEEEMQRTHTLQTEAPVEPNPPDGTHPTTTTQTQTQTQTQPQTQTTVVVQTQTTAPAPSRTPVYKKWWLWTVVGVVVVGVGVGVGVGLGTAKSGPSTQLGTVSF